MNGPAMPNGSARAGDRSTPLQCLVRQFLPRQLPASPPCSARARAPGAGTQPENVLPIAEVLAAAAEAINAEQPER
jgi:hypothetical protein